MALLAGAVFMMARLAFVSAQEGLLPSDAGFNDVKNFGAKGDGKTDDTAALLEAISDRNGFLYLPNGTYLLSDSVSTKHPKRRVLQGQSRTGVILKLKDNAAGFDDPAKPRPVLSLYDRFMDPKSNNGQAFRNSICNLTVDVGAGNPGAVALHYFNDNQGTVENVMLRSSDPQKRGKAGLALVTNWPGPALLRKVSIEGFDFGVWSTIGQYSIAFEHLSLEGQRVAGISNSHQMLSIRGLKSRNTVPAMKLAKGLVVLVDGDFTGGTAAAAIENAGSLYARNLKIQGYRTAIQSGGKEIPGPAIDEFVSREAVSLFPSPPKSLGLAVEESPELPYDPPPDWIAVQGSGGKGDDTEAIQKAIDAGKSTVYFPRGTYHLNDTVHVRGTVRRIIGMESTLSTGKGFEGSDKPAFRIEDGKAPVVLLERFEGGYGNHAKCYIEQATSRTLVLRTCTLGGSYRNTVSGKLFLDDVCGAPWDFSKQQVWARQLNPENHGTKIVNDGGSFWCLNLKTEKAGTAVLTKGGGKSEILGGYVYFNRGNEGTVAFVNQESALSFVAVINGAKGSLAQETRGGETRELAKWPLLFVGATK